MKELFDKELRNHIRDTFDHYDDLLADDAWKQFNKQKNKKKRALIFWYTLPSGIAAALALIWLLNGLNNNNLPKYKTELAKVTVKEKAIINQNEAVIINKSNVELVKTKPSSATPSITAKQNEVSPNTIDKNREELFVVNEHTFANNGNDNMRIAINPINISNNQKYQIASPIADSQKTIITETLTQNSTKTIDNTDVFLANEALLDSEFSKKNETIIAKHKEKKAAKSSFNLAFDANTYYNFTANQVNNQPNVGVGLLSEFRLSKRLSINTGIAINRQTTSFDGNQNSANSLDIATINKGASFTGLPSAIATSAKLVGFDIPINLKYDIKLGKANTFITTGLSSYTLLNEKYINEVSVVSYSLTGSANTSNFTSINNNPEGTFNDFQFARTINFSFGVLYPISKTNSLSLEPFMKYPLNGLGYENLKIGSGGISFKFTFGK